MKISILISILFCFLASCNNVARQEDAAKKTVNESASSPQTVNTPFKGEKVFELEYPPVGSNDGLFRKKYAQKEEECKTLCEKTCGGKCLDFWEVIDRCFKENPQLKRRSGGLENARICHENVPTIYTKYPFSFEFDPQPQRAMGSTPSKTVSPEPKTVSCRVTCN